MNRRPPVDTLPETPDSKRGEEEVVVDASGAHPCGWCTGRLVLERISGRDVTLRCLSCGRKAHLVIG